MIRLTVKEAEAFGKLINRSLMTPEQIHDMAYKAVENELANMKPVSSSFREWMQDMAYDMKDAAKALRVPVSRIAFYLEIEELPYTVALACAAVRAGLKPIGGK